MLLGHPHLWITSNIPDGKGKTFCHPPVRSQLYPHRVSSESCQFGVVPSPSAARVHQGRMSKYPPPLVTAMSPFEMFRTGMSRSRCLDFFPHRCKKKIEPAAKEANFGEKSAIVTRSDTGANATCITRPVQRAVFSENFPTVDNHGSPESRHNSLHSSEDDALPACSSPETQGKSPRPVRFRLTRFRAGD